MNQAAPPPKDNMGQPEPRIEARLKVTGEARYPADFPVNNLAHGVLVTSGIARGTVTAMHLDQARAVPGVLDILSIGDAAPLKAPSFSNASATSIACLQTPQIQHDGQIIALVVAETPEAAEEAAMLVRADYDSQPPSATFGSPGTETEGAAGVAARLDKDPKAGDFDAAFASAPVTLEAEYGTPTQHHNPIELFSTTAVWTGEQLTVYEPTQNVNGWRHTLADQMKMDAARVRFISPYIGGAFGSKGPMTPRTAIVALAARRLGRPVRCVVSRSQGFTTATYRAETRQRIRMGAGRDGKITAFAHEGWEVTSRPDPYVVAGTETTSRIYGYGTVWTRVSIVRADRNTPGYMRSPPETPYVYALESAMDEMAGKLGMDPVEFRRVNDTMTAPIDNARFTSRSLMACFDQAARAFGWSGRNPAVGSMRDGDWLVGLGCATAVYPTNVAAAAARVSLSADGTVRVQSASHEIGTGIRTVAAQMAAERLGVDVAAVRVEMGDSDLPPAPVSGGSNSTASVCSAVLQACDAIRARLAKAATAMADGPLSGRDPASLRLEKVALHGDGGASLPLKEAFKALKTGIIEENGQYLPEGMPPDALQALYDGKTTFRNGTSGDSVRMAFGAEFVEVRINARTREIRVPRIVGAFAAGRIMNTRTARSQLMGGMIWGISSALLEATEIDRRAARYVNSDLQEYLVPVNADIHQLEVILVPETDSRVNPAGVKGLGELGNVGTAAAVANAVYHATGKRVRQLPIRVETLLSA